MSGEISPPFPEMTAAHFEELATFLNQGPGSEEYEECCSQLQFFKSTLAPLEIIEEIIQTSQSCCARMLILTIFREIISVIWDTITSEQRGFIQSFFFKTVSGTECCEDNEPEGVLHILCLIEVLKKVWPQNWPEFTFSIIQRAKLEGGAPINTAKLFMFLFEEVKDSVKHGLPPARHSELESALINDTPLIASYIIDILSSVSDENLIVAALDTLATMLKWVDPSIFQSQQLITSIKTIFTVDSMKGNILNCFSVIPNSPQHNLTTGKSIETLYFFLLELISEWIGEDFNFQMLCEEDESTTHSFTLCLTNYLSYDNFALMEKSLINSPPILTPIHYLVAIFEHSSGPAYELILEFWDSVLRKICVDFDSFTLPDTIIASLITILNNRIVPPPDFPFDETERGEEEYSTCESLFSKLAQVLPEEAVRVTKESIQSSSGIKLFCDSYACSAIAYSLPKHIEQNYALEVMQFLLSRAEESQEHAIAAMIVAKTHIQFISKGNDILTRLIKLIMQLSISSSEDSVFQLFCSQAIDKVFTAVPLDSLHNGGLDIICMTSELVKMLSPECQAPFFHGLACILKNSPPIIGIHKKEDLIVKAMEFPIQQWREVCSAAETVEFSIFCAAAHVVEQIIDVNDHSMQGVINDMISCAIQVLTAMPADDQQSTNGVREVLFDVFTTVIKKSNSELVGSVVSTIVEDYISSPVECRNPKALGCFAEFVRRGVNPELTLQLSSELIICTAQNLIEYGDEIPSVEVANFQLISAVISCSNEMEEINEEIIEPLEQVIEWGIGRNCDTTVSAALSCIEMIVNSYGTTFSSSFIDHHLIQLYKVLLEAMLHPMDNMQFNTFCHVIQKMINLQNILEVDKEQLVSTLIEIITGIVPCVEDFQSSINTLVGIIVFEYENFSKLQYSLSELISELRTIAFRDEGQREQFHLEGGFPLTAPASAKDTLEEF